MHHVIFIHHTRRSLWSRQLGSGSAQVLSRLP